MTVKFGVFVPQGWRMELTDIEDPVEQYETMVRCAQEADRSGFDAIWLFDHFHTVPQPSQQSTFEAWTAMAALSRDTKRVRLGQMVTCNSYRPPPLLAKMSSCIDVMSHGRLIVGMGAGWYQHEYNAYGYEFSTMPDRLRMLRESLQVLKAMWTQEEATFHGRFYNITGAINRPKPVQRPHPPIWIGGGGEKVTLKLVAQYGDACNIGAGASGQLGEARHKLEVLRSHCETVGRDYGEITKSINFGVYLGDDGEVSRIISNYARWTGQPESTIREQAVMRGSGAQIAERIKPYLELGFDYVILNAPNLADPHLVERMAAEIIPRLA